MRRAADEPPREPFRSLLSILPTAAYACDADGLITYFNPAAERLWGRAPALNDPVDRYCGSFRLFDADGVPIAHDRCWMALTLRDDRSHAGRQIWIERPDGERVAALAYATPLHDDGGKLVGAVNVLVDVTDRISLQGKLRELEADYEDFFEHGSLGLHCVGPDGIVLRANQAELDMLGYERDEYVGHHISEFHADQEALEDILRRLAAGETLHQREAWMICKDGSRKAVSITSNVLFRDGDFVHTRCFTHDVTDRKKAEEALRQADERKDEFLAVLAHELRNPLAPIANAVEILRLRGPVDPEVDQARDVIERQVDHLRRLVDDLLSVARITHGKLELARSRHRLDEIVDRALETVGPLATDHAFEVSLPPEPLHLNVDPIRMSQALSNLLSNAAKYTAPGGGIRLRGEREGSAPGTLVLSVEDDGIGMEAGEVDVVFERFRQLRRSRTGGGEGLGLGLTLVRTIVEMHGGTVQARSEGRGRGSTFVVGLPLCADGAAVVPAPSAERPPSRRVLLVEDHPDAAASLGKLLEIEGHSTRVVGTGAGALRAAREFRPEVVLLDIGLPDIDGYATCRRLRAEPWGAELLLVALTGWGQASDVRAAHEAGFDEHLTKPTSLDSLRRILARRRDREPVDQ